MTYLVLQNFFVRAQGEDGKDGPKTEYRRGMTIEASQIPPGHSAEGFVAKGLIQDTSPARAAAPVEHDDT